MEEILNYLKNEGKTGLGFCSRETSGFYKKCGFKIVKDLALRFRYKYATPEEEQAELEDGGDGICHNGKDNFIKKILSRNDLIYIDVPFW